MKKNACFLEGMIEGGDFRGDPAATEFALVEAKKRRLEMQSVCGRVFNRSHRRLANG